MIDKKEMKKLETHSKKHKGGMKSQHIKNMMKFMEGGDNFIVAHGKAVKMDKKEKPKDKKNEKPKNKFRLRSGGMYGN